VTCFPRWQGSTAGSKQPRLSSPLSSGMRPIRRSSLFSNLGKPATLDTPFPPRYRPYSREPRGGGQPTSRMREAGRVSHPGREEAAGRSFHFLNCLGFESGLKIWREKRVGVVAERIEATHVASLCQHLGGLRCGIHMGEYRARHVNNTRVNPRFLCSGTFIFGNADVA